MKLLAIDPGSKLVGYAYFDRDQLLDVGVFRFDHLVMLRSWLMSGVPIDHLICEVPRVYPKRGVADPNDLIGVALTAGVCLSIRVNSIAVRPHEWKGSIQKEQHHARVYRDAGPDRIALDAVKPKSLRHNAWDAYALGRWAQSHTQDYEKDK